MHLGHTVIIEGDIYVHLLSGCDREMERGRERERGEEERGVMKERERKRM